MDSQCYDAKIIQPAMRPSAIQLLQHEKIDLALKVFETQKMWVAAGHSRR